MYMQPDDIRTFETPRYNIDTYRRIKKQPCRYTIRTLEREDIEVLDTVEIRSIAEGDAEETGREEQATSSNGEAVAEMIEREEQATLLGKQSVDDTSNRTYDVRQEVVSIEAIDTIETHSIVETPIIDITDTHHLHTQPSPLSTSDIEVLDTQHLPDPLHGKDIIATSTSQQGVMTRSKAVILVALLCIVVLHATDAGLAQFIGMQGWAYVLGGPTTASNPNLLRGIEGQIYHNTPIPGTTAQTTVQITPRQYVDLIVQRMTLDQKLGQMMIVQFVGPS